MANMAYCRFENTLADLRDCYRALCEEDDLTESEARAKTKLIEMCEKIADQFGDRAGEDSED